MAVGKRVFVYAGSGVIVGMGVLVGSGVGDTVDSTGNNARGV